MLIDTHAHLYLEQFTEDIDKVINKALDHKVEKILLPNIDSTSVIPMLALASKYPGICYPMIGLHPCSVKNDFMDELYILEDFIDKQPIVGIGEIGIDLYWDKSNRKEQIEAFKIQINWAKNYEIPIAIHSRNAIHETIRVVEEVKDENLRGVFHCFGEGLKEAERIIELGFYLGIGGVYTYKKSDELRSVITKIGLSRVILETDSPYLAPIPFRGKRNESAYISDIAKCLAESLELPMDEVAKITSENAMTLFKL